VVEKLVCFWEREEDVWAMRCSIVGSGELGINSGDYSLPGGGEAGLGKGGGGISRQRGVSQLQNLN